MRHSVLLPAPEAALLTSLAGLELHAIWSDRVYSVAIWAGDCVLDISPEEISTPFPSHPHGDAVRPRVTEITHKPQPASKFLRVEKLGLIEDVCVLTTQFSFSPVREVPEFKGPHGIVIPAGLGWGVRPSVPEAVVAADQNSVLVDVAIQLTLQSGRRIAFATDTISFRVDLCIDSALPDGLDAYSVRTELTERLS